MYSSFADLDKILSLQMIHLSLLTDPRLQAIFEILRRHNVSEIFSKIGLKGEINFFRD